MMVRRTLRAVVALTVAVGLTGSAAVPAAAAPRTIDVVNLGDSISAGIGSGDPVEAEVLVDCLQGSGSNHVDRLASRHRMNLLLDAACSGATTDGVQRVAEEPVVADALDEAGLVTLTMGANDLHYFDYVLACSWDGDPQQCDTVDAGTSARIARAGVAAGQTLAALDALTDGRIVLLGYPHLFDGGADNAWLSAERVEQLNDHTDALNAELAEAAAAHGATFVDVAERFEGHGADSRRPWIHFIPDDPDDGDNLHPTRRGYMAGYYPALRNALSEDRPGC